MGTSFKSPIFITPKMATMNKQLFFSAFAVSLFIFTGSLSAQVGINTDNSQPDPSAMLEVKSSTKGFLPPRVALISINSTNPIATPAVGLLVYNTANAGTPPNNVVQGYYYWNGTRWVSVAPPQGTNVGDMLYWNGTQWVGLAAGSNGQVLRFQNGAPNWVTPMSLIGLNFQGGIIFYIDPSGQHGLIAATSDQGWLTWGCTGTLIGTGYGIGDGQNNTSSIISGCPVTDIAARFCDNLVLNGYDDWFLPSFGELNEMYQKRNIIGGFNVGHYLSSTEFDNNYVWTIYFPTGSLDLQWKDIPFGIRAIRAF